jgi:signal transduction histidine kinase
MASSSEPSSMSVTDADLARRREQIHRGLRRANFAALLALLIVVGFSLVAIFEAFEAGRNARAASREAEQARKAQGRALLQQARAQRRTGEPGQRFGSLETVMRAVTLAPALDLRHEAIAALAFADVRFVPVWTNADPDFVIQFSPDFERIAIRRPDSSIALLRANDGVELATLPSDGGYLMRLYFSPDGNSLAANYSGSADRIWDLASRKPVMIFAAGEHFGEFSADSKRVLAGANSGIVRCLSFPDGAELWRYDSRNAALVMKIQPQGNYFACFAPGGSLVQLRSMESGNLVHECDHVSRMGSMDWSPDGSTLVMGRENGWIYSWDVATWEQTGSWRGHEDVVVEVMFDPSGQWLATSSWDGMIKFWSVPGYRLEISAAGYQAHQVGKFSSQRRRVSCIENARVFGFLDLKTSSVLRRLNVPPGEARGAWSVDASPDGKLLAASYENGALLLDFASGRQLDSRPMNDCRSILFTLDGPGVVVCGSPGLAYWPLEGLPEQAPHFGPARVIRDHIQFKNAALTPDGRWVAAANRNAGWIGVYNIQNPAEGFALTNHPVVQDVAVSANGKWIAGGTWKGRGVKIWDLSSRQVVHELPIEDSASVAFSPDNQLMITGSLRYQVWDTQTWKELYRRPDIGAAMPPGAFSPDGRLLAILKGLHDIELLEPRTGQTLAVLEAPGAAPLSALRFMPDGNSLVVLEWSRSLQIWDLRAIHAELGILGLDWESSDHSSKLAGPTQHTNGLPLEEETSSAATETRAIAPPPGGARLASATPSSFFYMLALGGVLLSMLIGAYTLRYNHRMLKNYEEVEGLVAERNQQLKAARLELLHSQKMRALGTLAAGIAHDFNNLLSIIRMSNKLIHRRAPGDPEIEEHVTDVEHAVLQGKSLVGSMLGYVRQGASNGEPSDACAAVESAVSLLTREFLSGIALTLELERQAPRVKVGHGRLEQVLLNLLVNASEAMQGQGKLKIALRAASTLPAHQYVLRPGEAGEYVELRVIDSGPGFLPEIGERLFEPFFTTKLDSTRPGTGLGLSLVYTIAQEDKLGLCAESEPGHGATFSVVMPVAGGG